MLTRSHVLEHCRASGVLPDCIQVTEALTRRACEQPTLGDAIDEILACSTLLMIAEPRHA